MGLHRRAELWIALLGTAGAGVLALMLEQDERDELVQDADARAEAVADAIQNRARERERILVRLARDLRSGVSETEVRSDAAEAVADHPDILAIARRGALRPTWVEPPSDSALFAKLAGSDERGRVHVGHGDDSLLYFTAPAGVDTDLTMAHSVARFVEVGVAADDYALSVRYGGRVIYEDPAEDRVEACAATEADAGPLTLQLTVCPRRSHAATLKSALPEVTFVAGAGLSVLVGRLLALERVARRRSWEAEHALGELASLTYAISHDFRAPVRALGAYARFLAEDLPALDTKARGYLDRIGANAQHVGALVDGILELARIARANVRLEAVDVSAIAEEEIGRLRTEHPKPIHAVVQPDIVVRGDQELLRLVLRQLLRNAWNVVDAPSGRVEVGAARVSGKPAVYVRDNGPGFDAQFGAQLFRPFQRTAVPASKDGVGFGLALAHTAVRRMAGRIWVEASPGHGANFCVIPTDR